jgi:uncharacterized membrane protein
MFLKNIKDFFKKKEKIESNLDLNNSLREAFNNILAPMEKTVVYTVLEKIKAKEAVKNNFGYKARYKIMPLTISLLLIFTLTGISLNNHYMETSSPSYSTGLKSVPPSSEAAGTSEDSSGGTVLIAPHGRSPEIQVLEQKSKTKIFFEKIWKFILNLWK